MKRKSFSTNKTPRRRTTRTTLVSLGDPFPCPKIEVGGLMSAFSMRYAYFTSDVCRCSRYRAVRRQTECLRRSLVVLIPAATAYKKLFSWASSAAVAAWLLVGVGGFGTETKNSKWRLSAILNYFWLSWTTHEVFLLTGSMCSNFVSKFHI